MSKPLIMVDIDGILNTLDTTVLDVYNEDSGDNLRPEDITEYHIEKFVKPEYKDTFYHYFTDKRVWKRIGVVPYAVEVLEQLWNEGYPYIFVTKTECENMVKKRNWLNRNLPFLGENNVRNMLYSCPKKQLIRADIAIDDGLFNLVGDRTYYSICFDKPYNQTTENIPCFTRVYDWLGAYTAIKEIEALLKENEDE